MSSKQIVVATIPLSEKAESVFTMSKNDPHLIREMDLFRGELEKDGVEVFEQRDNIIVTERGYFCCFYAQDLVKVDDSNSQPTGDIS